MFHWPNLIECQQFGAKITLIDGLISDCAKMVNERKKAEGWFDVSTLKEPFRMEGKKTMGMKWQSGSVENCLTRSFTLPAEGLD